MKRTVAVLSDMKDIGELLNGASLDRARFLPAVNGLGFELDLTRAMAEHRETVRQGFITRVKTPWVKSRLFLSQIKEAGVQRKAEGSGDQPLLACEAVPGGYTLKVQSLDGLEFSLRMDQLSGDFEDVGEPIREP